MKIKTHTFNGKKYIIDFVDVIEGSTDREDIDCPLEMTILNGRDFRAFHSAFHESLEASGFCDKCLHKENGNPRTIDAARFVWRWINDTFR